MATADRVEIHLSVCSTPTTKGNVLSMLKDSGVTDDNIVAKDGKFVISVAEDVATRIMKNKDKYPKTWSLGVVTPVCVTISYSDDIFTLKSSKSLPGISDNTIVAFLNELKTSKKISYGVVVTFKRVDACYYRQYAIPQQIYPLIKVEVHGSTDASFSIQNCIDFRNLLFNHFTGYCIAWSSVNDSSQSAPPTTLIYYPPSATRLH